MQTPILHGIEINPKLVGAIFTETTDDVVRVFCLYVNGDTLQFEVPVEENQASLNVLFRQLDMLDKCSSAIAAQVVQGRIYAQDEKSCWMYTLLGTAGSRSPGMKSNIHLLPWKRIWSAKGTEVLRLGGRWRRNCCYAVRTEITEEEMSKTIAQSQPFVRPTPPPARRALSLATLSVLFLIAALLAGGATWFHFRNKTPLVVNASHHPKPPSPPQTAPPSNYYLLVNREIKGPLPMSSVLQMQQSGAITPETLARLDGELDWRPLQELLKPTASK
jgi:hypothetical protein